MWSVSTQKTEDYSKLMTAFSSSQMHSQVKWRHTGKPYGVWRPARVSVELSVLFFSACFFVAYCVDIWPVFLFWLHPSCLHDGIGYFIWAFNYLSVINSSKILCSLAFAAWAFWKCQFDCSSKFIIWVCWCFFEFASQFSTVPKWIALIIFVNFS